LASSARTDGAGGRIQLIVEEIEHALVREALLVGQADAHRAADHGALALVAQEGAFVALEIDLDRVERDHRGQQRAGIDQVAGGDHRRAHAAADRRGDPGEVDS
jgi:hypothetical protein